MPKQPYPECKDRRGDCFSLINGKCRILTISEFNGRKCPFYKTDRDLKPKHDRKE